MRRVHVIVDGYVQQVGFREHVRKEIFGKGITGFVKNLDTGEVEIVAEGREDDLEKLLPQINIIRYPIEVTSCNVTWEEATGEFTKFSIIRGDIQQEIFERMDYAGVILHENLEVSRSCRDLQYQTLDKQDQMLDKQDQMLDKQDQMLDKQDQMIEISTESLQNGKEIRNEVREFRKDAKSYLDDEFREIKKKLISIEDALARAGIQV